MEEGKRRGDTGRGGDLEGGKFHRGGGIKGGGNFRSIRMFDFGGKVLPDRL